MERREFQSLIGRLQTTNPKSNQYTSIRFQSLIGRLQTTTYIISHLATLVFQSLIGRLQTKTACSETDSGDLVSIPHR